MAVRRIAATKPVTSGSTQKKVTITPATKAPTAWDARSCGGKKLRVAAYARVSTEQEEQQTSFENQTAYYTRYIQANPEWEFVKVYGDDGKSGTLIRKRDDFQNLLEDCKAGKIDLILCKSISRFARNALESLQTTRMLKDMGIGVLFEKEGVDTRDSSSDIIFTIFSSIAENESQTLSSNISWGYRRKFEAGSAAMPGKLYGYDRIKETDEAGRPVQTVYQINESEAEVVKKIYGMCLDGFSVTEITKQLDADGVPTPRAAKTGKDTHWSTSTVLTILRNEKYTGDATCQKSYTVDPINKIRKQNTGERPMYHIENHHPAIISHMLYNMVQEELERRAAKPRTSTKETKTNRGRYTSKYALASILFCGECGSVYKRCVWTRNHRVVWRCKNRWENGKKYCPNSVSLEEEALHAAISTAMGRLAQENTSVNALTLEALETALGATCEDGFDQAAAKLQIKELNQYLGSLAELQLTSGAEDGYFEQKMQELAAQRDAVQKQLDEHTESMALDEAKKEQLAILRELLNHPSLEQLAYDEALVHKTIERIAVLDAQHIRITFVGGIVMEQTI